MGIKARSPSVQKTRCPGQVKASDRPFCLGTFRVVSIPGRIRYWSSLPNAETAVVKGNGTPFLEKRSTGLTVAAARHHLPGRGQRDLSVPGTRRAGPGAPLRARPPLAGRARGAPAPRPAPGGCAPYARPRSGLHGEEGRPSLPCCLRRGPSFLPSLPSSPLLSVARARSRPPGPTAILAGWRRRREHVARAGPRAGSPDAVSRPRREGAARAPTPSCPRPRRTPLTAPGKQRRGKIPTFPHGNGGGGEGAPLLMVCCRPGLGLGGGLARSTVGEGSARPRPARASGPEAPGARGSLPAWARSGPSLPAHAARHPPHFGFCGSRGQSAGPAAAPGRGYGSLWMQRGILAWRRWPGSGKGNAGILLL